MSNGRAPRWRNLSNFLNAAVPQFFHPLFGRAILTRRVISTELTRSLDHAISQLCMFISIL